MWTVAVRTSASFGHSREHRNDDRRNVTELNHGKHLNVALAAQETFAAWPRIWSTLVRAADGPVDQLEVRHSCVLLKNLRVDQRRQNDPDAFRRSGLEHDLHAAQRTADRRPNPVTSPALLRQRY